jgi:hypothetical protein
MRCSIRFQGKVTQIFKGNESVRFKNLLRPNESCREVFYYQFLGLFPDYGFDLLVLASANADLTT